MVHQKKGEYIMLGENDAFFKDSRVMQNETAKFADAIFAYLDKHPQGLVSLTCQIRASDGRELMLDTSRIPGCVDFRTAH